MGASEYNKKIKEMAEKAQAEKSATPFGNSNSDYYNLSVYQYLRDGEDQSLSVSGARSSVFQDQMDQRGNIYTPSRSSPAPDGYTSDRGHSGGGRAMTAAGEVERLQAEADALQAQVPSSGGVFGVDHIGGPSRSTSAAPGVVNQLSATNARLQLAQREAMLEGLESQAENDPMFRSYVSSGKNNGADAALPTIDPNAYTVNPGDIPDFTGMATVTDPLYSRMTEREKNIYYYYFAKDKREGVTGQDSRATAYLNAIKDSLNRRSGEGIANRSPELVTAMLGGLDQTIGGAQRMVGGLLGDTTPRTSDVEYAHAAERQQILDSGRSPFLYDLATTISSQIPTIALSVGTSGIASGLGASAAFAQSAGRVAGNVFMGASAFGNSYNEMIRQGYTPDQARTMGALVGASETLLGEALGGIAGVGIGSITGKTAEELATLATSKIGNAFVRSLANGAINYITDAFGEAVEEGAQEILEPIFRSVITGEKFTPAEWSDVMEAAVLGGLSAGALNAVTGSVNAIGSVADARKIRNSGLTDRLRSVANTYDSTTVAGKMASRLGEDPSAVKVALLLHEMQATISDQTRSDIVRALQDKGLVERDAETFADVLTEIALTGEISPDEQAIIDSNEAVSSVFYNVVVGENSTVNQRLEGLANAMRAAETGVVTADTRRSVALNEMGQTDSQSESTAQTAQKLTDVTETQRTAPAEETGGVSTEAAAKILQDLGLSESKVNAIMQVMESPVNKEAMESAGLDAETIVRGIRDAARFGIMGTDPSLWSKDIAASQLPESIARGVYSIVHDTTAAKQSVKRGTFAMPKNYSQLNKRQKTSVMFARRLHDLGIIPQNVQFYSSVMDTSGRLVMAEDVAGLGKNGEVLKAGELAPNGGYSYGENTIWIDLNAGNSSEGLVVNAMAHELTHAMNRMNAQQFRALADAVAKVSVNNNVDLDALILQNMARTGQNYTDAAEDVVCETMERMWTENNGSIEKLARELYTRDKGLYNKVKNFFAKVAATLRKLYKDTNIVRNERDRLAMLAAHSEEVVQAFTEGVASMTRSDRIADLWVAGVTDRTGVEEANAPAEAEGVKRSVRDAQESEDRITALRTMRENIVNAIAAAEANGNDVNALRNRLANVESELNGLFAEERRSTVKTSMQDVLDNLSRYRITDLYSIAEQLSDGAWDDYEELSRAELEDGIREIIEGRELSPLQMKAPKYGVYVRPSANEIPAENSAVEAVGVEIDEKTGSANPVQHSLRTWETSDYMKNLEEAAAELAKATGVSKEEAEQYIIDVNNIAKIIASDRQRYDYESAEGSPFVSNVEYGGSIDFSTICKKRLTYTGTLEAIQNAMPDHVLTAGEMLNIRAMMMDKGYEVACGLCYVEGSRVKVGEYAAKFLDTLKKSDAKYIPDMSEVNTIEGLDKLRKSHPEIFKQYTDFMNRLAQRKPKMFMRSTEYTREILDKFLGKPDEVEEKNKNGGLRIQSFSDFLIVHLLDSMQVITDMARVGLAGQAYTKVGDFARALGNTGLKINLSLIAKDVDENGKLVYDEVNGMKRAEAEELRNAYSKNVGTIIVVFTDEQLKAAMADPFIDYIIPFHRSQWNKKQYAMLGLPEGTKDYTSKQNERYAEPVLSASGKKLRPENRMPNDYWDFSKSGKYNAEAYLRWCAENNRIPKFSNLLVKNADGSYSLQPDGSTDGYWKLLIDFKMYDNKGNGSPQLPVKPVFNMAECKRMLAKYHGDHRHFPVAQEIVDAFVAETKEREGQTVKRSTRDRTEEERDEEYLTAVKAGNMNTAQRMVDEAAKDAGYTVKAYHGTANFGWTRPRSDWPTYFTSDSGVAQYFSGGAGIRSLNGISAEASTDDLLHMYLRSSIYEDAAQLDFKRYDGLTWDDLDDLPKTERELLRQLLTMRDGYKSELRKTYEQGERIFFLISKGLNTEFITESELREKAEEIVSARGGVYDAYLNLGNTVTVDAHGAQYYKLRIPDALLQYANKEDLAAHRKLEATTDMIVRLAAEAGYDSVTFRKIREGDGAGLSDVYAVMDTAKQMRSADPVTYDDNGNVIPLSERFNADEADIRYSQRDQSIQRARQARDRARSSIERDFESLHKYISLTASQGTSSLDPNSVKDVALRVADGDKATALAIAKAYRNMYTHLKRGDDYGYDQFLSDAKEAAELIATERYDANFPPNTATVDREAYASYLEQAYGEIYDGYWDVAVSKTATQEARATAEKIESDFAEYRDAQQVIADARVEELHAKYSEQLAEMRDRSEEKISELRRSREEAKANERWKDAQQKLLLDWIEARAEAELQATKEAGREALAQAKAEGLEAVRKAKEADRAILEHTKEKLLRQVEEAKANERWSVAELRAADDIEMAKEVSMVRQQYKRRETMKRATQIRRKIKSIIADLTQSAKTPSERRFIPLPLLEAVERVAEIIDTTGEKQNSKAAQKRESDIDAVRKLSREYRRLSESGVYRDDYSEAFSKDISDLIDALEDSVGQVPIRNMPEERLNEVLDTLDVIASMIRFATQQIGRDESITNYQAGQRIIDEMDAVAQYGLQTGKLADILREWTLNPMRAARELSGFNEDSELVRLFNELNEGTRKADDFRMEALSPFDQLRADNAQAYEDAVSKPYDFGLVDVTGKKLKITKMQAMQLVMTWEREQANPDRAHLQQETIIPDIDYQRKGDRAGAMKNAQRIAPVTQGTINTIIKKLNSFDLYFMQEARRYYNEVSKNAINSVSATLQHKLTALEDEYIPYELDRDYIAKEPENLKIDATLMGSGMLKSVVANANQPIVMRGLDAVLAQSIDQTAKIYGIAIPVRNLQKAWNMRQTVEDGGRTAKSAISAAWNEGANKMIEKAIADVQAPRRGESFPLSDLVRGAFVKSTLASNLSVWMKQAASYPTAGSILSTKALTKGLKGYVNEDKEALYARIDEVAGAAHWKRRRGLAGPEVLDTMSSGWEKYTSSKLGKFSPMNWIQGMDVATTAALFCACEEELKLQGVSESDEGYKQKLSDLYNRVIEETQPVYDPLHRAEIAKTTNELARNIFMFQTQPLQNSGILRGATMELRAARKRYGKDSDQAKSAGAKFEKAVASQVAAQFTFTAFTLIGAALLHKMGRYEDDDKELTAESVLREFVAQFGENVFSAIVPVIGSMATSLAEKIIGGSRYDVLSDSVVDKLNDTINAFAKLRNPTPEAFESVLFEILSYFGFPLKNAKNIIKGIRQNIEDIFEKFG